MITQSCAICGKNNFTVLYPENFDLKKINSRIFSARRLPDRMHYRMVVCKNCSLLYSNPILEYGKIEKLYKKSFTSYDEHLKNLQQTYGFYLKKLKKYFAFLGVEEKEVPPARRIFPVSSGSSTGGNDSETESKKAKQPKLLEIGCGKGFFLEEARRQGYDVYGIEPGKPSVDKARPDIKKRITADIFKSGQFKQNFFDVICCFQTFDHLPDPNAMLKESYKILKRGGLMLFFNHDAGAWQNRLLGEKSPIIDIEHTYLYDKKTMAKIFEKHGFKILKVESAFNVHHLAYWMHLFPLPNIFKLPLIRFLNSVGLGNIKIRLNPGNLVLIATK